MAGTDSGFAASSSSMEARSANEYRKYPGLVVKWPELDIVLIQSGSRSGALANCDLAILNQLENRRNTFVM